MLGGCWSNVVDGGSTLIQNWANVWCLLYNALTVYPASSSRWPNVELTLAHCLRRCPNISITLSQRVVPDRFVSGSVLPANNRSSGIVVVMLGKHLMWWPRISPTSGQCLLFTNKRNTFSQCCFIVGPTSFTLAQQ